MSEVVDICVPDIGDFSDVPIIEIPVSIGDDILVDDTVVVLESDKATLDVPSERAGRITEFLVAVGDTVSMGVPVARMQLSGADSTAQTADDHSSKPLGEAPAPQIVPPMATVIEADPVMPANSVVSATKAPAVYASPSVRRFARTLGVDVGAVAGTGPKGRILRDDVEGFVKATMLDGRQPEASNLPSGLPDWPEVDFAKFGPIERVALSRIARISGPALARNSFVIPHVCNFDKADITDLEAFRKVINTEAKDGQAKVTMLAFAVKAVVAALKAYPKFNSALSDDNLILRKYWNIGVAADTPDGLVVPVIRDADQKGVAEVAGEMAALAAKAREGKLSPTDMSGATFTISSLGGIGGTGFTPIINAPEVAILGMTRAEVTPVWQEGAVVPRLIQPLSLSWDHRVVDGVAAARFLQHVSRSLGDFRRISL